MAEEARTWGGGHQFCVAKGGQLHLTSRATLAQGGGPGRGLLLAWTKRRLRGQGLQAAPGPHAALLLPSPDGLGGTTPSLDERTPQLKTLTGACNP